MGGRAVTYSSAIIVRQEIKPVRQTPGKQTLKEMGHETGSAALWKGTVGGAMKDPCSVIKGAQ